MDLPPGKSEEEVLQAIEKVVTLLGPRFTFGCYDVDDIRQQGRMFALEALPRYDNKRPLANFLYSHVKNRLINFKRDKYRRTDAPCAKCHRGEKCTPEGVCKAYADWAHRNNAKAGLMCPADIENFPPWGEADPSAEAERAEILRRIDRELPVELRSTYLQMKDGLNVSKVKKAELLAALREIFAWQPNEDD